MTLDQMMAVFGGLCVVTLLVVAWPVWMGLWPILVVALLHLVAVGWCFRRAWRNNWAREIFWLDGDSFIVEQLKADQQRRTEWPIAWTWIRKETGRFGEVQCFLVSRGEKLEIGAFLPAGERERLARMLEEFLSPRSAWSGGTPIQVS